MSKFAVEILEKRTVIDANGRACPLHSETSREQGEFLARLVRESGASVCLEIGLAYGISTLFIAGAIEEKPARRLISIDPFQDEWNDIGLLNLERAGFRRFVEFHREKSHATLPRLLAAGERIDFAYIDTSKVFDVLLIDAYYLIRLLKVGGLMVFDDCTWPGVKKLVRLLARMPFLEITARHNVIHSSLPRRVVSRLVQFAPKKNSLFAEYLVHPDERLGTNAHCIAFKKTAEDERRWDWFQNF